MEAKARYRVFWTTSTDDLETQLNGLASQGYSLAFWDIRHPEKDGETDVYHSIMKLDTGSYADVTGLKDVEPGEVDKHLLEGWEIASCSISTKFVRMVKRKVK